MANDIVISAAMSAALRNLQNIQIAALSSLKSAAQSDQSVANLISQSQTLGTTTATRGTVLNTSA
ncbi:MAG TPA: hypothetical protein ENI55_00785 [Alphaproteobacteria bacterium]|nr:hypothetical protein [Alphaproteobacteria bacterium]